MLRAEQELARPGWTHIYLLRLRCDSGKRLHSQGRGQLHPMQTRGPGRPPRRSRALPLPPPHSPHSSSFRGSVAASAASCRGRSRWPVCSTPRLAQPRRPRVEAPLSKWVRHRDAARGPLAQPPARQRGCVFTGTEQPPWASSSARAGGGTDTVLPQPPRYRFWGDILRLQLAGAYFFLSI